MTIGAFLTRATNAVLSEVLVFFASLQSPVRLAPEQIDRLRRRVRQVLAELVGAVDGGEQASYEHEKVMAALKKLEDTITAGCHAVLADEPVRSRLTAREKAELQKLLVKVVTDAAHAGQRYQAEVDRARVPRKTPPPLPKVVIEPGGPWDDDKTTEPQTPRAKR